MEKFEKAVTSTLATHTTKLDNIHMQLKSIDRNFVHNLDRINRLETGLAFMKGMGLFVGSVLTIFIALVAYLG
jgi:hypothetical protein